MNKTINEEKEAPVLELTGRVKWFDPAKGYGFITSDGGRGDILLHQSCLVASGLETALQGATIHCEAAQSSKGLQAIRVCSIDNSTALADAHSRALRPEGDTRRPKAAGDYQPATVKWFNRVRGYGFVTLGKAKSDIFLHMETLRCSGIDTLDAGQAVNVRIGEGPKGLMVAEIKL